MNSVLQHGGTICDCSTAWGERAVAFPLYHRQSGRRRGLDCTTSRSDHLRGFFVSIFRLPVTAGGTEKLAPPSLFLSFNVVILNTIFYEEGGGGGWGGVCRTREEESSCRSSPSRSLVFLQSDWARFVKDGWLASKGLCENCALASLVEKTGVLLPHACQPSSHPSVVRVEVLGLW